MTRKRIDWEKVEKDYYARILTIKEVADKYRIADSTLRERAKKYNWKRDVTGDIKRRTDQKLAELDAAEFKAKFGITRTQDIIDSAIESAAIVKANVIIKHRKLLSDDIDRVNKLEAKFDSMINQAADLRDIASITQAFKSLVESKSKLIALERQSFKIEDAPDEESTAKKVNVTVNFV